MNMTADNTTRVPSGFPAPPPPGGPLFYESRGVMLVIGGHARVLPILAGLLPGFKVVAAVPDLPAGTRLPGGVTHIPGPVTALRGHLGNFFARSVTAEGEVDLGPFSPNGDGLFDLVIDFSEPPLIGAEVSPYGYYPAVRDGVVQRALHEAPGLVGRFSKQRYFRLNPDLCAHGRRGLQGCTRCLDACPAGAIDSAGEQVQVDAFLCQGCGTCTLVCPTGALSYARPAPALALDTILETIDGEAAQGNERIHAVLLDSPAAWHWLEKGRHAGGTLPALPLEVKRLTSIGMESWFAILARGAAQLTLLADPDAPVQTLSHLESQVALARRVLHALGMTPETIDLRVADRQTPPVVRDRRPANPESGRLAVSGGFDKRAVFWQAVDALAGRTGPVTGLPSGAPFGSIEVRGESCTLCSACVKLCPTSALGMSPDRLRLTFVERDCIQCGLCVQGCPEGAMDRAPRLLMEPSGRDLPRTLHEGEMAACVQCGSPIMSRALLEAGRARVADHPMFQGERARIFDLCPQCRILVTLTGHVKTPRGRARDGRGGGT